MHFLLEEEEIDTINSKIAKMKIKVNCDDGYETHLQIPEDISFDEVINEVENLRKTQGYDLFDLSNTATRNLSVAYQVHRTQNQGKKGNSSSLEFSDLQYVSRRLSVKTVTTNLNEKNNEIIVYLYGFKSQQQSEALQQLYQFSSRLSFLNVAFNQAIEKYATQYPTPGLQGGYQNLLSLNGSSSGIKENSGSIISISSRSDQNPLEIVSNRLVEYSSDIQRLFDENLSRPNLDPLTKSTLIKAKNSFIAGDLASTISALRFPSLHPDKGDSSSSSFSLALVPSSVSKEVAEPAKKGQKAATTTPKKDTPKKETPKKETKANKATTAPAEKAVVTSSASVPMEVEEVPKTSNIPPATEVASTTVSAKEDNKPPTAGKQNNKAEPKKKPEPVRKTENPVTNKATPKKEATANAGLSKEEVPKEETKTTVEPPKEVAAVPAPSTKPAPVSAAKSTATKKEESSSSSESGSDSESDSDSSTSSGSTRVSSSSGSSGSSGSTASSHTKTSSRSGSPAGRKKPSSTPLAKNLTPIPEKKDKAPSEGAGKSDTKNEKPSTESAVDSLQTQPLISSTVIDEIFASPIKPTAKFVETPSKKTTTPAVTSKPAESLLTPSISTPAPAVAAPVQPTLAVSDGAAVAKPAGKAATKANAQKDATTSLKTLIGEPQRKDDDSDSEASSGSESGSSDDSDSDSSGSRSDSEDDYSSSDDEKDKSKKGLALTVQTSVKKPSGVSHARTAETPSALMSLLAANPVPGRLSLSQTPASAIKVPTSTPKVVEESESSSSSSDDEDEDEKKDEDDDIGSLPKFSPPPAVNIRRLRSNSKEGESKPAGGGKALPVTMKPSDKTKANEKKNTKNQKPKATGPSLRALVGTTTPKEGEGKKIEEDEDGSGSDEETVDELVLFQPAPPKPSPNRRGAANKRNAASAGLSQGPPSSQASEVPKGKGGKATTPANKRTRTTKSD